MKEVTIENGGTPIDDLNDVQCTHIVINDQEIKQLPSEDGSGPITPTSKQSTQFFLNMNIAPFTNTRALVVRAEWFWASIQICCRASECLYEFVRPAIKTNEPLVKPNVQDPPNKRIKLSVDNLLSNETLNSTVINNNNNNYNAATNASPHNQNLSHRNSNQFIASNQINTTCPSSNQYQKIIYKTDII